MKVLVACEYSGTVRDAFLENGHDAWSCDLLESDSLNERHLRGDVRWHLDKGWDLMLAFPPCTHLCVSGARWFSEKQKEQYEAIQFFLDLALAPIPRICIENPIGIMSTHYKEPTQIVQPWMFGHGETKATCLWLKNLPPLTPTDVVKGREQRIWKMGPSPDRGHLRSLTYPGLAKAMADQWNEPTGLQLELFG